MSGGLEVDRGDGVQGLGIVGVQEVVGVEDQGDLGMVGDQEVKGSKAGQDQGMQGVLE